MAKEIQFSNSMHANYTGPSTKTTLPRPAILRESVFIIKMYQYLSTVVRTSAYNIYMNIHQIIAAAVASVATTQINQINLLCVRTDAFAALVRVYLLIPLKG